MLKYAMRSRKVASQSSDTFLLGIRMTFTETTRLLFRSHQAQDEEEFIRMHTDPEVRRYVGGNAWSFEKARDRFRHQYLGKPSRLYGLWATVMKDEQKYIGCCGLRADYNANAAHLGYYLARPYWGQGFASEASKAFIEIAFKRLRLRRLSADVDEGNAVSRHILQKFGFALVGREEIAASGRVILLYELPATEGQEEVNRKKRTPA
jgi:ribosomal-protein-alanine N-acetyltransferase